MKEPEASGLVLSSFALPRVLLPFPFPSRSYQLPSSFSLDP